MEQEVKEKKEQKEQYVSSDVRAICGAVNGTLFYNYLFPVILILILQLIFRDRYQQVVNDYYAIIEMSLNIAVSVITVIVGLLIANPKRCMKAFNKVDSKQVKTLFITLGAMIAFSMVYNSILLLSGLDVGNGNENQQEVTSLIKQAPALAFIAFVLVGPMAEELTYRYFIFGGIKKYNTKAAIIISGLIFMIAHGMAGFTQPGANLLYEFLLLPPYLFSGMALAYAYNKYDNIAIPLSIHMLNNLISFVITMI